VTIPTYALAIGMGVGRIGQDRHWASDILGSAVLGVGTAKLLNYWHSTREAGTLTLSPLAIPGGGTGLQVRLKF